MIQVEYLNNGTLIMHYSDKGVKLLQSETGEKYDSPIDLVPCRYSYSETDEPVVEETEATNEEDEYQLKMQAYDIIIGGREEE